MAFLETLDASPCLQNSLTKFELRRLGKDPVGGRLRLNCVIKAHSGKQPALLLGHLRRCISARRRADRTRRGLRRIRLLTLSLLALRFLRRRGPSFVLTLDVFGAGRFIADGVLHCTNRTGTCLLSTLGLVGGLDRRRRVSLSVRAEN